MKLFQCDWCEKQNPCRPMAMDGKSYDICAECRGQIEAKLKGKGEPCADPLQQIQEVFGKQRPWQNPDPWGPKPLYDLQKHGSKLTGLKQ